MLKVITVPEPVLESSHFTTLEELPIICDQYGGLPIPLPHAAVLEVIALVDAIKSSPDTNPSDLEVAETWKASVLGTNKAAAASGCTPTHSSKEQRQRTQEFMSDEHEYTDPTLKPGILIIAPENDTDTLSPAPSAPLGLAGTAAGAGGARGGTPLVASPPSSRPATVPPVAGTPVGSPPKFTAARIDTAELARTVQRLEAAVMALQIRVEELEAK